MEERENGRVSSVESLLGNGKKFRDSLNFSITEKYLACFAWFWVCFSFEFLTYRKNSEG